MIDHLLWAVPDLEAGIDDIARRCGVRPALGGRHPGVGTHNALLSLGAGSYLEVIAPDPEQSVLAGLGKLLEGLLEPQLLTWAEGSNDLEAVVERAVRLGLQPGSVRSMSRHQPDGNQLSWRLMQLEGHPWGPFLPFYLDWGKSTHPSLRTPGGCRLRGLRIGHPSAEQLNSVLAGLGSVQRAEKAAAPKLVAELDSPRGRVVLR